ncbi:hypothetical protein DENSPDRAFT_371448 [Dentipellis sp. KUC8613]|nr:hypothetical protein DENSPDRAFT_371448 [Dentipellis sp. KUC8613]
MISSLCEFSYLASTYQTLTTWNRLHKEKKKMMTQVTNLNRQVKQLKSKLSEAEASLTPSVLTSNPQPAPVASTSSMIPPVPPIPPTFRQSTPPTPRSRTRTPSGPFMSALQKQKTPETKGYVPVFRAKTPEPKQATTPEASVPIPTFSKGKKRPAPDDAESSAPVQGFTPEGALDPERNTDFALTPRVRKSLRTGFTPTRNTTSRPVTMLAPTSPARTSMPFVPPNTSNGSNGPIILDVTNNPRSVSVADSKAPKRTWLGKMRGTGHSRSATAPASRSNVFDRAPPGRGS